MRRFLAWWQWLLIGTGFLFVGIVVGPVVERSGHGSFATLITSLLAVTTSAVCHVIGAMRFAKWLWAKTASHFRSQSN